MALPLNQRITNFYRENKGIIWLVVIAIILYYIISGFYGPSTYSDGVYSAQPMVAMEKAGRGEFAYAPPNDETGYVPEAEKRIKKTAYLDMETEKQEYEKAKGLIDSVVIANNGFYVSKNEYKSTYNEITYKTFNVVLKVPVASFDSALEQLKKVAEIKRLTMDATDLTSQYHDLETDLETQKSLKKRIEALLSKAEKIEDIIKLEEKLSEYQQRIDNLQKQLVNMGRQTDYSTITITLEEKREIKESFYEFTELRQLIKNIIHSIDSILVTITSLFGWIILVLLIWGSYKFYHRKK